jgi:hypothetical protein
MKQKLAATARALGDAGFQVDHTGDSTSGRDTRRSHDASRLCAHQIMRTASILARVGRFDEWHKRENK